MLLAHWFDVTKSFFFIFCSQWLSLSDKPLALLFFLFRFPHYVVFVLQLLWLSRILKCPWVWLVYSIWRSKGWVQCFCALDGKLHFQFTTHSLSWTDPSGAVKMKWSWWKLLEFPRLISDNLSNKSCNTKEFTILLFYKWLRWYMVNLY